MVKKTVQATVPASNKANTTGADIIGQVEVDFPETVKEAAEMYGEEAILSNAFANWRVTLQGAVRRELLAGKTQEEIQARLGAAKMGVALEKGTVDPIVASLAKFKTMDPEQQKEFMAKLRAAAAGK